MPAIDQLTVWAGLALLFGFLVVILGKLMSGSISLAYLLYGDARTPDGSGRKTFFSAGRAQLLTITLMFAGYYLLQVIQHPTKFPDVPNGMLYVLGGSHAVYLGGKAQSMYLGRIRDLVNLLIRRAS